MTDLLELPSFLRRAKDNTLPKTKLKRGPRMTATKPPPTEKEMAREVLDGLSPETSQRVTQLIANHKFRDHWLLDASIVAMVERQTRELATKADEKKAAWLAHLATLPKEERVKAPAFGHATRIRVLIAAPRKAGSKGAVKYAEMVAWVKAHPAGTVAELFAATSYAKADFAWDLERKAIETFT